MIVKFNFKKSFLTFLLLLPVTMSYSQIESKYNFKLDKLIFQKETLLQLIHKQFNYYEFNWEERFELNNEFSIYKINRRATSTIENYSLFGYAVEHLYGYTNGNASEFAIYLMVKLDVFLLNKIVSELGNPEGIESKINSLDDHNILFWSKERFQVLMTKRDFGNNKNKWGIIISNLSYKALIRDELGIR